MSGRPRALLRTPDETPDKLKQEGWTLLSNIDRYEQLELIRQLKETGSRVSLLIRGQIVDAVIHDGEELETRLEYTAPGNRGSSISYLRDLLAGGDVQVLAKNFTWNRSSTPAVRRETSPEVAQTTLAHWLILHEGVSGDFPSLWERLIKSGDLGVSDFYLVDRITLKGLAPESREDVARAIASASTPLVRAELDPSRDANNQHRIITGNGPHHSSTTLDLLVRGKGGAKVLVELRREPIAATTRVELFTVSQHYIPSSAPVSSSFQSETRDDSPEAPASTPIQAILRTLGQNMSVHAVGRKQIGFHCEGNLAFLTMEDLKDELQNYGLVENNHKWKGNISNIEDLYTAIIRFFRAQIDSQRNGNKKRLALERWINVSGLHDPYIHIETDVHATPPSFTATFHLGS